MENKLYVKDGVNFEGISMQEGKTSSTFKLLGFMIVTVIVIGLLIFTVGSLISSKNEKPQIQVPGVTLLPTLQEPTITIAITPRLTPDVTIKPSLSLAQKITVTPTQSISIVNLKLEIENGSGIKGAAGKMSTALTAAGYTIISTSNADSFNYKGITIKIQKSKTQLLNQLKKDLSASNYLVTESTTTFPESSTADVLIIIGAE
jgi:hypothetical protein